MEALGVLGIIAALIILICLIFRGWHMGVVAILSSVIVILTSQMDMWPAISESFATSFKNFAGTWFLMFALGAVFGKVMEESGASVSIANTIVHAMGKKQVILIVLVTTLILSYGGIGVFVIAFTMYPICMALFKEADLPKKIFPGLLLAIPATICMSVAPGVPAVQNMIPTETFGTTIYAAPVIGIICSIFIFILDYLFYTWAAKRCREKGEHFIPGPNDNIVDLNDANAMKNLPGKFEAFVPLIVLIASMFLFQKIVSPSNYAVVLGMVLAIAVALVMFRKKLKIREALASGTTNGLNALMVTSSIMGFGGVVSASPAFTSCVNWLLGLNMSPMLLAFFSINIICAITGSSSGGLNIFLNTLGEYMLSTGINTQILHRLTCIASAGLDAMPHASGVVLANDVAKTQMKDTYKYTFVSQCVIPMLAFWLAFALYHMGLC
ncbi:MAG: GntP family permease [Enterocloster asparagiformis]|nr:GntP family permease [Enterocloster asparagiformis]